MQSDNTTDIEVLAVAIREASRLLSLSPYTVRAYVRRGVLPSIRLGRRILIPTQALLKLLNKDHDK